MLYSYPSRSNLLLYLAGLFALLTVAILCYAANVGDLVATDSIWFKPAKYAASLAGFSCCLWVYTSYLPLRRQKLVVGSIIFICLLVLGLCYTNLVVSKLGSTGSFFQMDLAIGISVFVLNLTLLYLLWQLTRVDRRKLTLPYLFGIRFGLLLFIVSGLAGMLSITGPKIHTTTDVFGHYGFPFYNWQIADLDIRVLISIGAHSFIYLPCLGNLLGRINGTKYSTITTGAISVISIALLMMVVVMAVAIKIGRPLF
jgi:hypothetical protein